MLGGGDWSKDRLLLTWLTKWSNSKLVEIRSPEATRPWQHVLEPLSGYLWLGADLHSRATCHGESFNFAPQAEAPVTVSKLITDLASTWQNSDFSCNHKTAAGIPFK